MPTTRSPLRYPGGKTAYAPLLRSVIARNGLSGCDYAEPFAGGAGAAIDLLLDGTVAKVWLNDLDPAIFFFWKAILEHTEAFIQKMRRTPIMIAQWHRQREIYRSNSSNALQKGFATFFLNRCNRAGILTANPIGGLRQDGDCRIDARFKKEILAAKIRAIATRKQDIRLSNLDAKEFLTTLQPKNPKTLVYFDPPYYQKGGLLYLNHFRHEDHVDFSSVVMQCPHAWILSYDDCAAIRKIYARKDNTVKTRSRQLRYSIAEPSRGSELLITKLRLPRDLSPTVSGRTQCH